MLPLNCTVASLGSDAVGVVLSRQHLAVAVALDISSHASEVLGTVGWGPDRDYLKEKLTQNSNLLLVAGSAGDLPGENVECLGCCKTGAGIGQSHADGVGGACPIFSVH